LQVEPPVETMTAPTHPIRAIKRLREQALAAMGRAFDRNLFR